MCAGSHVRGGRKEIPEPFITRFPAETGRGQVDHQTRQLRTSRSQAMTVRALVVLALSFVASMPLMAQTCSGTAYTNTLICTVPQLFGPAGMALDNQHHNAHFADNSESQFRPLNQAIGQELSILPLGSAGAGTTITMDSEGHVVPTEDSLGPILTERANVIGRKRFALGVAYQYFSFDKIDGIDLHSFPAVLLHEGSEDLSKITSPYQNDYI